MDHVVQDRIDQAVEECLGCCLRSATPFTHATQFIHELHDDPLWSFDDLARLQARVVRVLSTSEQETVGR